MTKKPQTAQIKLPPKLVRVFSQPRGAVRYRGAYGGRGSAKSRSFALMAAIFGYAEPLRILCTREFQVSIRESFHAELKAAISQVPWLQKNYEIGVDYLRGYNGTEFLFRGLRRNMQSIRSLANIDLCIVEEAEDVPETAWQGLTPTVRAPNSEIWAIWNPRDKESPVDSRFIQHPPDNALIAELNFRDNPWFPEVLEQERQYDQRVMDPATYAHVWEGKYLEYDSSKILADKYRIEEFEPPKKGWDGPYFGLDFGFAMDPTTANKLWINGNKLMIEYEANKVGLELDHTPDFLKRKLPGIERHTVRADSARPESISHLKRHGLPNVEAVDKWQGSVEDGVSHLRSYEEIVIHPRCEKTIEEFRLYSYKVDRHTGDILPQIVDAYNHHIDDIRYALQPKIKGKFTNYKDLI